MAGAAAVGLANVDALLLGAVGAGSVAVGAAAGVGQLAYKVGRGIKRKFSQMSSGYATDTQMGGAGYAGATNILQRTYVRQKFGRKMRRNAKNAHRLLQASMAYCVQRWQRVYAYGPQVGTIENEQPYPAQALSTNYSGTTQLGRLNLGHLPDGVASPSSNVLPGYLFNLTSWNTVQQGFNPCNRLYFDNTGTLKYHDIQSQNVASGLSLEWKPEVIRGLQMPPAGIQNAFLMWSDIRLAFYGAAHCPTRIIVELIQFKKDYFDPYNTAGVTSDQQAEINMHYINEFKNLVFHPLDVNTGNRAANIKVLSRKVYEIGPDTTSSEDPASPNILCKMFKRFNRLCNWRWRNTNTADGVTNPTVTDPNINPKDGDLDAPDWQIQDQAQLRNTVVPRARVYLYVRAEAMRPVLSTVNQSTDEVKRHCPSFDICVRNKWQYEN